MHHCPASVNTRLEEVKHDSGCEGQEAQQSATPEVRGECVWLLQSSARLTEVLLLLIPLLDSNTVLEFVLSVLTC